MTIIRQGVNKLGSYTLKKVFTKIYNADEDGSAAEQCIAAVHIPAYVHPGYIWMDIDVTGVGGMAPQKFQEMAIRGSIGNAPQFYQGDDAGDDWDAIMNNYMPSDPDQIGDFGGTSEDVGITGREHVANLGHEFFRRECTLGLPNYAYPSGQDEITYKAHFSYRGHGKTGTMVDIKGNKTFVLGVTATVPDMYTSDGDKSNVFDGGYGAGDTLYQALRDNIPAVGGEGSVTNTDDTLPSQLSNYLYKGFEDDDFTDASNLNIRCYLTMRLDVYEPTHARYTPAP